MSTEQKMKPFESEMSCDRCGSKPTRVFYGPTAEDDLFLCRECATTAYCRECHRVFTNPKGLKIHQSRVH